VLVVERRYLLTEGDAKKISECPGSRRHEDLLNRFRFVGNIILQRKVSRNGLEVRWPHRLEAYVPSGRSGQD
jgi:hypothetical protein